MNAKKRPSVIVMKRLDTQGMRVLSQSAGEGTRRAGVRLSPKGGLLVHRRGEPITSAPPPNAISAGPVVDTSAPTMPAPVTFIPNDVRAYARAALEEQIREGRAESDAPAAVPAPLPALRIEPAPRRSLATWSIALVTLGLLTGVTIARLVGSAHVAIGGEAQSDSRDLAAAAPSHPDTAVSPPAPSRVTATVAPPLVANAVDAPLVAAQSTAPAALDQVAPSAPATAPRRHHHASRPVPPAVDEAKNVEPKVEAATDGEDAAATSALVREQLGNSL